MYVDVNFTPLDYGILKGKMTAGPSVRSWPVDHATFYEEQTHLCSSTSGSICRQRPKKTNSMHPSPRWTWADPKKWSISWSLRHFLALIRYWKASWRPRHFREDPRNPQICRVTGSEAQVGISWIFHDFSGQKDECIFATILCHCGLAGEEEARKVGFDFQKG